MVSDAFRRMEDKTAEVQMLHDDLVNTLAYKLNLDKSTIEQALYRTGVTTGVQIVEIAHIINEFHMHLKEILQPPEEEQREDESK